MSEEKQVEKPSLLGIIWSPTEQFERIRERPAIWGALAIITLLFIIGMWLQSLGVEVPEIEGLTEEQLALTEAFATVGIIIGGLFTPVITILISSFIYWIVAKIAQSDVSFKQLFSMTTYITVIAALSLLVNGALNAIIGGGTEIVFTSLGWVVNAEGAIGAFFNNIEVFSIWGVILTALGLHKVAGFSKGLAWTIAIVFFVIGVIFAMISAGMAGMVGV